MPILAVRCQHCGGGIRSGYEIDNQGQAFWENTCTQCARQTDEDGYPLFHPIGAKTSDAPKRMTIGTLKGKF